MECVCLVANVKDPQAIEIGRGNSPSSLAEVIDSPHNREYYDYE